ncbi:MAG: hypothetical protein ABIP91_07945 [Sphingomicrobium sp.]
MPDDGGESGPVAALDARIAQLGQARAALAGLAGACASQRGGSCPILDAFESQAASRGGRRSIENSAGQ